MATLPQAQDLRPTRTSSSNPNSRSPSTFLSLPRELRDNILLYTVLNDLFTFSHTTHKPACLFVSHQLQEEYSEVLFKSRGLIKLDSYQASSRSWHEITDLEMKRDIFLHCEISVPVFASSNTPLGILEFMNGSKRVCEGLVGEYGEGGVRMGILTICTRKTAVRRWHWSIVGEVEGGEK